MRDRKIPVGLDRSPQFSDGFFTLGKKDFRRPVDDPPKIDGRIARAQPQRILDVTRSLFATAHKILGQSDIRMGGSEIPVDRKRSLDFGNALRGPVGVDVNGAQAQMS